MFPMLLFILWTVMILFSLAVGARNSVSFEVLTLVNFSRSGVFDYTFGLHHIALVGEDASGRKVRMEKLSIGIILFTVVVTFFKPLPAGR